MPTITFYRQARRDGGLRTGIDIDDETVLSRFEPGNGESDPTLLWYVDVRCQGKSLPASAEGARNWLTRHGRAIGAILKELADEIPAGIDPAEWPLRKQAQLPSAVHVTISCSAVRRVEASRLGKTLRELAAHWREWVEDLAEVEA